MESKTVSLRDARVRLGELTELATAGTDVVIARRGRPMARLTAAPHAPQTGGLVTLACTD